MLFLTKCIPHSKPSFMGMATKTRTGLRNRCTISSVAFVAIKATRESTFRTAFESAEMRFEAQTWVYTLILAMSMEGRLICG